MVGLVHGFFICTVQEGIIERTIMRVVTQSVCDRYRHDVWWLYSS